jgi:hypothetical protein
VAKSEQILRGRKEIADYIKVSIPTFYELVKSEGLPATIEKGAWVAYVSKLEEYYRRKTLNRPKEIDETAE